MTRFSLRIPTISTVFAAAILACGPPTETVPNVGPVSIGTWGGDSAGMIVSDTATHLHIACTYGDISGRIPVDVNGAFDVQGSYTLRAYPIVVGPSVPARFVGRWSGSTVTVTVIANDTVQHQTVTRGPVSVTLGVDPRLGPCPICRRPTCCRRVLASAQPSAATSRLHNALASR